MKNFFTSLMAMATLFVAFPTFAQFASYSGEQRVVLIQPPLRITNAASSLSYTSAPIDIRAFKGEGMLWVGFTQATNQLGLVTNGILANASLTINLQQSDTTNAFTNCTIASLATLNTILTTNLSLGTNWWWTNQVYTPGTLTTATPATDGFAGKYVVLEPYTNTTAYTSTAATGTVLWGLPLRDMKRYIRMTYDVGGSNNIYNVSGILIGHRNAYQ